MTGRGEAGFSKGTSDILAKRAGYRCSEPGCRVVTVGPGDADEETASVGTAAHIHSAALNGPRGRGNLTDEELSAVTNGIWCCANHGREIDTNSGRGFTVEKLRSWKAVREDDARRARSGIVTGAGWINKISINRSPLFKSNSELILEKALYIQGPSIGKTSLFEWLACAGGNDSMKRWARKAPVKDYVRLAIDYNSPSARKLVFEFDGVTASYEIDGKTVYSSPSDLSVILLSEDARRRPQGYDDLQFIAYALATTAQQIRTLLPDIERSGSGLFEKLRFEEAVFDEEDENSNLNRESPYLDLILTVGERAFEQHLETLAGSELSLLLVDFACALARSKADTMPTLLLIEAGATSCTQQTLEPVVAWLLKQRFQTLMIVTDWQIDPKAPSNDWSGVVFRRDSSTAKTLIE